MRGESYSSGTNEMCYFINMACVICFGITVNIQLEADATILVNNNYMADVQNMRIHLGIKPYRCEICQRKFTQLSHLQQHIRTHTHLSSLYL